MLYPRSTQYAIRAMVHLAQVPAGEFRMVKAIANAEDIPAPFLAKILQQLAKSRLVRSSKGRTGGFALGIPPAEIRLFDIARCLDALPLCAQCALYGQCPQDFACPLHDQWAALRDEIETYLKDNTVATLVVALETKRAELARRARR